MMQLQVNNKYHTAVFAQTANM